jgi:hypothetical protein
MCQCGERLPDAGEGRCHVCGTEYERAGDGIRRRVSSR